MSKVRYYLRIDGTVSVNGKAIRRLRQLNRDMLRDGVPAFPKNINTATKAITMFERLPNYGDNLLLITRERKGLGPYKSQVLANARSAGIMRPVGYGKKIPKAPRPAFAVGVDVRAEARRQLNRPPVPRVAERLRPAAVGNNQWAQQGDAAILDAFAAGGVAQVAPAAPPQFRWNIDPITGRGRLRQENG